MEEVLHRTADPIKVKLERGKTYVGWEISVQGNTEDEILDKITSMDRKLLTQYQTEEEGK